MGRVKSVVVDDMEHCVFCGWSIVQIHHIFHGFARNASDRYGYVVPICDRHHRLIHDGGGETMDLVLKKAAQEHFEAHHGSREDFIQTFGRSYL